MDEKLHAIIALHHLFDLFVVFRRVVHKFLEQWFVILIVLSEIRDLKTLIAVFI